MNGFGIREQWAAGRSFRGQRMWRDDILLHQLTVNGSLLLVDNTDELYRSFVAPVLAQPLDSSWQDLHGLVTLLPAHLARRTLWRASLRWWQQRWEEAQAAETAMLEMGRVQELVDDPQHHLLLRRLDSMGGMLVDLSWCNVADGGDEERIQVASLREAQRQADEIKRNAASQRRAPRSVVQ